MDVEKRIIQTSNMINSFISDFEHEQTIVNSNATNDIVEVYQELWRDQVKPVLREENRADRYKIASIYQHTIILVQLFSLGEEKESVKLNAKFAFSAAFSVISNFEKKEIILEKSSPSYIKKYNEYLTWLETIKSDVFPVILNSFFLETFCELYSKKSII